MDQLTVHDRNAPSADTAFADEAQRQWMQFGTVPTEYLRRELARSLSNGDSPIEGLRRSIEAMAQPPATPGSTIADGEARNLADAGLREWAAGLPVEDNQAMVRPEAERPVRWVDGIGWVYPPT